MHKDRTAADQRYYQKHRDHVRKRQRQYYQAHQNQLKAKYRRRYWLKKIEAAQSQATA